MADANRILARAIKEEILRNVMKNHRRVLVLGLRAVGKTCGMLSAIASLGAPFYFCPEPYSQSALLACRPDLSFLDALRTPPPSDCQRPLLVVDAANKLPSHDLEALFEVVKSPAPWHKVVLISRILIESRELMPHIDAVVKMKENTAELMYSELLKGKIDETREG
ncbi:MAG TPA: hypothetical protein VK445_02405 [Dissulfurispiraceae bacterium]|nr:hypothetical protein [Dissulfurispiraceae bacterium]